MEYSSVYTSTPTSLAFSVVVGLLMVGRTALTVYKACLLGSSLNTLFEYMSEVATGRIGRKICCAPALQPLLAPYAPSRREFNIEHGLPYTLHPLFVSLPPYTQRDHSYAQSYYGRSKSCQYCFCSYYAYPGIYWYYRC